MAENGQEIEIRIFPNGQKGKYFVKAGHRRIAAAKMLGWDSIRAVVETAPEDEAGLLLHQYIENALRENMSFLDTANVYGRLIELGWSQHEIAQKFGISDTEVSLTLSVLGMSPKLQEAVENGSIKPSALRPLASQPVDVQEELAEQVIRAKTVRKISALVSASKRKAETNSVVVEADVHQIVPSDIDPMELLVIEEAKDVLSKLRSFRSSVDAVDKSQIVDDVREMCAILDEIWSIVK